MIRQTFIISLALLVLALPAVAETINETHKVAKDGNISIEVLAGDITVTGWNKSEVKITGTLDPKADSLEVNERGGDLEIEVEYPDDVKNVKGSTLEIMVPVGCDVEISTVSCEVAIDEVEGEVEAETVSGSITMRGEPTEIEAATVSGSLDIKVESDVASLACVSGTIEVTGVRRELECAVVSGSITVDAGKAMESLECETVSGDIDVIGQLPRDADWSLAAHSGDVTLTLKGKVNAEFSIETFSGDIDDDAFGHKAHRTSKYAPGRELDFSEGDGSASVEIEAFSGDVTIRKR